jgi:flagellar hook-associated protein 1 FlgK
MSSLLSIGKSGVLAYQSALAGISENVVNANNDGFAKRQVTMKEQYTAAGPAFLYRGAGSFNGVQAADVTRVWDQYSAFKAWDANSDNSQASTRSQFFSTVQDTLDDGDAGVGVKLTAIFTTGNALAANPIDATLRQSFVYALQDASGAINKTAANLTKVSTTVSTQVSEAVGQINDALTALTRINLALKTAPQGTSGRASLEDQRDTIIGTISDKIGIDVTLDNFGSATLKINDSGGPMLLDGGTAIPGLVRLSFATNGTFGMIVENDGTTSAVSPTSGSLAGYAEAANQIAGRKSQLDTLAANLVLQVNTWNAQGTDLNGNPGGDLMTGTDAASLAVSVTDTNLIGAADATSPNGNLLTLSALRGPTGAETNWRAMVNDQALRVQSAKTLATSAAAAKDGAYSALDNVSGVDLDTEAAQLMHFQQAYSASAKIIQTARETMQAIFDLF